VPQATAAEFTSLLEACEYARYASSSGHEAMDEHYIAALDVMSAIPSSMKKKHKGPSAAALALILALTLPLGARAAGNYADSLWTAGVSAYSEGRWDDAAAAWQGIAAAGLASPELYCNLGDARFKAELYPEIAPNTVNNFISLINHGFYDGVGFHRVIKGFMLQGGDPDGTGMGGPGYSIKGEFASNGFKNDLRHTPGVLSMARTMFPDSAGSQFFIMHKNAPHLDGDYAAFGQITEGMDVVNKIAETETDYSDRPVEPQVMKSVTVETFGVSYPEPEIIE
jgi:peptidyl-prolyl cis-trans isomerase B (cyclophilin B)